ncbi:MAG: fused MFS/spermidine synthase [Bdellovibrionales bacterium]|nr:fused MFS/spermidine synthase [Bdellovibrionales bacterium]
MALQLRRLSESASTRVATVPLAYGLFIVSGFTALLYEVTWLNRIQLLMGHTVYSLATTLCAYLAGLAVGAWFAPRLIATGVDGLKLYLWAELAIGLYGLLFEPLLRVAEIPYSAWVTAFQPGVPLLSAAQFLIAGMIVFIPTALMGTTLPVLCSSLFKGKNEISERLPSLYAANTVGACLGAITAGFALLPWLGYRNCILLAAGLNLLLFLTATLLVPSSRPDDDWSKLKWGKLFRTPDLRSAARGWMRTLSSQDRAAAWILFLSGAVSMWCQILWNRLTALGFGPSSFVFPMVTSAILGGIVAGSLLFGRLSARNHSQERLLALLPSAGAILFFAGTWALGRSPGIAYALHLIEGERSALTYYSVATLWVWLCLVPPSAVLGAMFPAALSQITRDRADPTTAVGRGYALNVLGLLFGALSGSFLLLPVFGIESLRQVIGGALFLASAVTAAVLWKGGARPVAALTLGAVCLAVVPAFDPVLLTSGLFYNRFARPTEKMLKDGGFVDAWSFQTSQFRRLLAYRDDPHATIGIHEPRDGDTRFFTINGKVDGNNKGDLRTTRLVAQLAVLAQPSPKNILTVGLGIGSTLAETLAFEKVERSTLIELSPAMIEFSKKYFPEVNGVVWDHPAVRILNRDGREFLRNTRRTFDLIISEPSNPWVDGVASLFTREYYAEVLSRLTPGGVALLWFHSYGLSCPAMASVLRAAAEVFNGLFIFDVGGDLYMIARREDGMLLTPGPKYDSNLERLADTLNLRAKTGTHEWYTELVNRHFLFDRKAALAATEGFVTNTDDNQILQFDAGKNFWRDLKCNFVTKKRQSIDPLDLFRGI